MINSNKKLKGIIAGCGYFAQFHIEAWSRIPDVEIIVICDLDIQKARQTSEKYGIKDSFSTLQEALQIYQPDFVDIATSPNTHVELCTVAAKNNCNIIVQKPLAPTFDDALKIKDLEAEYNIRIMVHENFRFQPWHRAIKSLLSSGTIGKPLNTLWRMRMGDGWQPNAYLERQPYFRDMPRLLIYETGIHMIDTLRYYFGEPVVVHAKLKRLNPDINGEDTGMVFMEFEGGNDVILDLSRYHESDAENPRLTFGEIFIEGEKGRINLYPDGKITIKKLGEHPFLHQYNFKPINFAGDCVYATQKHFVESLLTNNEFETSVSDYLKNIRIQDEIYKIAGDGNK